MNNPLNLDIPKVKAMIDHISYIISIERPTFAEWKFVMTWIDCEHEYQMGSKSAMDFFKMLELNTEKMSKEKDGELYR